jgi:DNA-binding transcriptional LysR family regulator
MLCRSIADAARVLGVSQPTQEAKLLLPDADRIFRELQSLQCLRTDLRDGTDGILRVGATASLAPSAVPDALALYCREFGHSN